MLLDSKTVIVTGAAGGLGAGIARVCYREGANVIIADILEDAANTAAESLGERAIPVACDVSSHDDLRHLVSSSVAKFGRIDGLVNNAGLNFVRAFLETTPEDWDRVINVDLRAVFFLTQLVCREMLRQNPQGGAIVNISSVHSMAVLPGSGPYDAAKWGVIGISKSVAVELAMKGVRVNVISPGLINSRIWQEIQVAAPDALACATYWNSNIPMGRVIEPDEIGELAAFLLSDRSACITGANIYADAGMTSQLVSKEPYQSTPIGATR